MRLYIKEAREQAGYSQKELAEMVGVAPNTFHGYESGKHDPKSDLLLKIANACGVSVDFLLGKTTCNNRFTHSLENARIAQMISEDIKKATSVSDAAMQLAKDYETLDAHGKATVRVVMGEELNRMEELENLANLEPENEPKIINLFDNPSAAGLALDDTGQGCQPYELKDNDPQGASYAVRVQGDSMEPYFQDGSIVFINHDQMRDGDIGIFCVDGATVIKQWHYDRMLGITYLFSLNRKRADADVVITRNSGRSCVWQGRVMTRKRFDLPGM